jgi:hypothetical protein
MQLNHLGACVSISNGRLNTTFIDDATAVPATAVFSGGCAYTHGESAYVCLTPAGGLAPQTLYMLGGRLVRGDGAQVIAPGGTIAYFLGGLGYTAAGALVCDTSAPAMVVNGVGTAATGSASLSATS